MPDNNLKHFDSTVDYYARLGFGPGEHPTEAEIKTRFRKLAQAEHPDRSPDSPQAMQAWARNSHLSEAEIKQKQQQAAARFKQAQTRFQEMSDAYDILGHGPTRDAYDNARGGTQGEAPQPPHAQPAEDESRWSRAKNPNAAVNSKVVIPADRIDLARQLVQILQVKGIKFETPKGSSRDGIPFEFNFSASRESFDAMKEELGWQAAESARAEEARNRQDANEHRGSGNDYAGRNRQPGQSGGESSEHDSHTADTTGNSHATPIDPYAIEGAGQVARAQGPHAHQQDIPAATDIHDGFGPDEMQHVFHGAARQTENLNPGSGSTLTAVAVGKNGQVTAAHVGDSPYAVFVVDKNGNVAVVDLRFEPHHLPYPKSNVINRYLGGDVADASVDIRHFDFSKNVRNGDQLIGVAFSDGMFNIPAPPANLKTEAELKAFEQKEMLKQLQNYGDVIRDWVKGGRQGSLSAALVEHGLTNAGDNVSASVATEGQMAIVADGNGNTADVAKKAVKTVKEEVRRINDTRPANQDELAVHSDQQRQSPSVGEPDAVLQAEVEKRLRDHGVENNGVKVVNGKVAIDVTSGTRTGVMDALGIKDVMKVDREGNTVTIDASNLKHIVPKVGPMAENRGFFGRIFGGKKTAVGLVIGGAAAGMAAASGGANASEVTQAALDGSGTGAAKFAKGDVAGGLKEAGSTAASMVATAAAAYFVPVVGQVMLAATPVVVGYQFVSVADQHSREIKQANATEHLQKDSRTLLVGNLTNIAQASSATNDVLKNDAAGFITNLGDFRMDKHSWLAQSETNFLHTLARQLNDGGAVGKATREAYADFLKKNNVDINDPSAVRKFTDRLNALSDDIQKNPSGPPAPPTGAPATTPAVPSSSPDSSATDKVAANTLSPQERPGARQPRQPQKTAEHVPDMPADKAAVKVASAAPAKPATAPSLHA